MHTIITPRASLPLMCKFSWLCSLALCSFGPPLFAQVGPVAAPASQSPQPVDDRAADAATSDEALAPPNPLAGDQAQVAVRFKRLEELLLKSAEMEAASNPGRAALLQQAAQLGKQSQLTELLARAAKSLEQQQYSQAVEDQKVSRDNLKRLLELLQSENRQDRVREQRDQVRRWIEETDRLRRLQSSLRGRTEGGQQAEKAASDQAKLAEKAAQIAEELGGKEDDQAGQTGKAESENKEGKSSDEKPRDKSDEKDSPADKKSDSKRSDSKQGDSKQGDSGSEPTPGESPEKKGEQGSEKPKSDTPDGDKTSDAAKPAESQPESKPDDSKSQDSESKPSPGKPSESKPSESKPSEGKPSEGKPSESESGESSDKSDAGKGEQSQQPQSPTERAAQRIKQAQKRMQEAKKQLDDAQREGAVEKQREAEQELQAAIEQLEEILRQLREEEIERSLAALEDRLRLMLQSQTKVLEETERLQEIAGGKADRQIEIRASNLSLEERKILSDGQRALLLLREEGTSAAFPEAMAQMLVDIQSVVDRLAKADTGKLTISIEKEIVSSLEEMIEALVAVQKDQKKRKEQRQSPGGGQPGQQGEQPLVDQLAEMRLIRTLQMRINKRTQSLSEVLKDPNDAVGQADAEDIHAQLRGLSERQASIKQVTRDIVVGKTK